MKTVIAAAMIGVALFTFIDIKAIYGVETVYGWQLMSEQERKEHRDKLRSFRTEQEREAYRQEHHERMQARAREQGVTLPDRPQPVGKGMRGGQRCGGQGKCGGAGKKR